MSAGKRPIRVGLVEDNVELREEIIAKGLRDHGFEVVGLGESKFLFLEMLKQPFDVVVIDIGLPRENGLDVARQLREISEVGIVILTSNRRKSARINALMGSADAFLSKPVEMDVLVATIHSLMRRIWERQRQHAQSLSPPVWKLGAGHWSICAPSGTTIPLTANERAVMRALVQAQGSPVEREKLHLAIDPDPCNFDGHRLDMMIHRLRNKAMRVAGETLPLQTTRGLGYAIVVGDWQLDTDSDAA
ncbi:response regulator transcription factor [Xanthomonas protegens]|uniref:Response regulator transcription factor n=1 Tax=Xanthomonas protegens TaxID=3380705 RepID=A0ABU9LG83_9XANT